MTDNNRAKNIKDRAEAAGDQGQQVEGMLDEAKGKFRDWTAKLQDAHSYERGRDPGDR